MISATEEINKLSLDERAFIAIDIQNSFSTYDEEFTDEEKLLLDEMTQKGHDGLEMSTLYEVLENLDNKYTI